MTNGWNDAGTGSDHYVGKKLSQFHSPANVVAYSDAAGMNGNGDTHFEDSNDSTASQCTGYETGGGYAPGETGDCGPFKFNPSLWTEAGGVDWSMGVPGASSDWGNAGNGYRRPVARHNGRIECAFADGHVKTVLPDTFNARVGSPDDIWHDHE